MKKVFTVLVIVAVSGLAQATIIDNFSAYDPVGAGVYNNGSGWTINGPANGVTIAETGIGGTLGGNRTTTYTTNGTFGTSAVLYVPLAVSFANNGMDYAKIVFSYSNFSIDLTTGTKLTLDFDPDHLTYTKNAIISMTIGDGSTTSTVTKNSWGYLPYDPARFNLDFAVSGFSGVNLTAVKSISLSIETDVAGDYAFYGISTDAVPEPATMALLGLGGLLLRRRK